MTIDIDRLVPLQTALKKLHSATSVEDKLEASTLVRNELVELGVLSDIDDTSSPKDNRVSIGESYSNKTTVIIQNPQCIFLRNTYLVGRLRQLLGWLF